MKIELYHYIHCPYCIRVRMALGFLNMPWSSKVLPYSDEATPLALTGKKMLPIIKMDDQVMNESLDIIKHLDKENVLLSENWGDFDQTLNTIAPQIFNLAMPFWVFTPEFDPASQKYFLKKKEAKRGPFSELIKNRGIFENEIHPLLTNLEKRLKPFWDSNSFGVRDIGLAAHLWGLFSVPEFRFSEKIHAYLMSVKELTKFNYTNFHWREP